MHPCASFVRTTFREKFGGCYGDDGQAICFKYSKIAAILENNVEKIPSPARLHMSVTGSRRDWLCLHTSFTLDVVQLQTIMCMFCQMSRKMTWSEVSVEGGDKGWRSCRIPQSLVSLMEYRTIIYQPRRSRPLLHFCCIIHHSDQHQNVRHFTESSLIVITATTSSSNSSDMKQTKKTIRKPSSPSLKTGRNGNGLWR